MSVAHGIAGPGEWQGRRGFLIRWVPRLLFLIGTVTLTVHSVRAQEPSWVVWGVFAVCSIVFIVRQMWLGHGLGDSGPRGLTAAGAFLCAAGATTLILSMTLVKRDGLPLIGAVVLILGLGWWVECWRHFVSTKLLGWVGASLLVLAGLIVVVGALMLDGARDGLFVGLLVALGMAVFAVLPLALNSLSAWGLRTLRDLRSGGSEGLVRRLGVVGLVVMAAAAGFVVWLWRNDWRIAAVLAGCTVLLLLAIVSNTHADVALVLAGLCWLAAAPPERPDSVVPSPAPGGKKELVALGDSYMSGEGAGRYIAGTNDGGDNECRRAPSAFAVKVAAAQDLGFDGLRFIACSGARTFNVVAHSDDSKAKKQKGEPGTQIDQLKRLGPSLDPKLVIISLGGNDAGFSTIGAACINMGNCDDKKPLFTGNLESVQRALKETYLSLKKHLPPGVPIVAIPYPQPIANAPTCKGVALTKGERDFIRTFVDDLNEKVDLAAGEAGILYLEEMKEALKREHLQLCDRRKADAGINFVDLKSVGGLSNQRFNPGKWLHNSLHPNERGHEAMHRTFETWLDKQDNLKAASPQQNADTARPAHEALAEPEPQCSLAEIAGTDCQLELRDWQVQQVLNRWLLLLGVAFGLIITWAMSIAIIGQRRQAP
ncbi:GDSL-type esterase/lipase family protein [Streptomyces sp. NPDC093516]|uniref:GDSL-type esterase/lipase family protein n=1 Tax=Streptomyces sp. NPDC093516 TaxID=3155304 RepID=UPI003431E5B3